VPADVRPARPRPLASRALRRLTAMTGTVAGTVLAAGLLSGCGTQAAGGNVITVSAGACGTGWRQVTAGTQTFQIRDSSIGGAEADLINPASGAVYAEVAGLGPGTTRPMRVNLGSGR
jgi:iron uptake system component EfeO